MREEDYPHWADQINRVLAQELPLDVLGYPTNFRPFEGDEAHLGHLGHMQRASSPPINHGVMLTGAHCADPPYIGWRL